jgi:hypothetical protein
MAAAGRADTYDQRAEILGSIVMRNRVIAVLRIAVPATGIAAFLLLIGQIYLANMARQYGVAGIRIDRGTLVVEAPQYAGTGSDGSRYLATAREARTPLGGGDIIDMNDATLDLVQPDGIVYNALTKTARMNTRADTIEAPGLVDVTGTDGLVGTLHDVEVNSDAETVLSKGAVDLILADGTIIKGSTMLREGKKQTWTFTNATVIVPDLPESELSSEPLPSDPLAPPEGGTPFDGFPSVEPGMPMPLELRPGTLQ